jgi:transposase InsO family protein
MSRKMDFVERAQVPGAKLAPLCREFGISRQTGHKWLRRYRELGFDGLEERSRRPMTSPFALGEELVAAVLQVRDAHPTWGPKKIHALLRRRFGEQTPSQTTVARMLGRFGRIRERRHRRPPSIVERAPRVRADQPNDVWTVDFKGWWRSHDGSRCEPLTVRDAFSRFVVAVTLARTSYDDVRPIFERLFRKHGLPTAIQCDNGGPFVSAQSRAGLSRLSAWWVALGIHIVRSRRGCPQDNGAHERMHRDMAAEVENVAAATKAEQQRLLDRWRLEFNRVRPHEALDSKTPAELYHRSKRPYRPPAPAVYPPHFVVQKIYKNGTMRMAGDSYFVSLPLGGHHVGLEPLDEMRWRIWFHQVDCGEIEIVPEWFDHVVPQPPRRSDKRPERHDARRRPRLRAATTAARATHDAASETEKSVNFLSTGS